MKEKASKLTIAQGNCITYMTADLKLVHLKILMTIIKELQKPVQAMIADIDSMKLKPDAVLPPAVETADGVDTLQISRRVTVSVKDIGLGNQNTKYLLSCLSNLREKTCIFPTNPGNPSKSKRILVTGLISHFTYNQTLQTIDVYLLDVVARKLLHVRDGYTKYDYLQAMDFSNKYTVRMYWIINSWRARLGFRITMEQLRFVMSAEDKYPRDDNFISKVIKVAYDELKEKGDIWFEYSRDCREGHDIFSFKVYQRMERESREALVKKVRERVFPMLSYPWKLSVKDAEYILGKFTADNCIGLANHIRYVTDTADFSSIAKAGQYLIKAVNTYLDLMEPIDSSEDIIPRG